MKLKLSLVLGALALTGCVGSPVAIMDMTPPTVEDGVVYSKDSCGVTAIDADSGKVKWRVPSQAASSLGACEAK